MALDSNKPYNSIHNGGDGIWDGAAWGLGAGAVATGTMYGATMHGSKHLESLNQKRLMAGSKKPLTNDQMAKRVANSEMFTYRMNQAQKLGGSMFGGKRALVTGTVGLLGGALAGAGIDSLNKR